MNDWNSIAKVRTEGAFANFPFNVTDKCFSGNVFSFAWQIQRSSLKYTPELDIS